MSDGGATPIPDPDPDYPDPDEGEEVTSHEDDGEDLHDD